MTFSDVQGNSDSYAAQDEHSTPPDEYPPQRSGSGRIPQQRKISSHVAGATTREPLPEGETDYVDWISALGTEDEASEQWAAAPAPPVEPNPLFAEDWLDDPDQPAAGDGAADADPDRPDPDRPEADPLPATPGYEAAGWAGPAVDGTGSGASTWDDGPVPDPDGTPSVAAYWPDAAVPEDHAQSRWGEDATQPATTQWPDAAAGRTADTRPDDRWPDADTGRVDEGDAAPWGAGAGSPATPWPSATEDRATEDRAATEDWATQDRATEDRAATEDWATQDRATEDRAATEDWATEDRAAQDRAADHPADQTERWPSGDTSGALRQPSGTHLVAGADPATDPADAHRAAPPVGDPTDMATWGTGAAGTASDPTDMTTWGGGGARTASDPTDSVRWPSKAAAEQEWAESSEVAQRWPSVRQRTEEWSDGTEVTPPTPAPGSGDQSVERSSATGSTFAWPQAGAHHRPADSPDGLNIQWIPDGVEPPDPAASAGTEVARRAAPDDEDWFAPKPARHATAAIEPAPETTPLDLPPRHTSIPEWPRPAAQIEPARDYAGGARDYGDREADRADWRDLTNGGDDRELDLALATALAGDGARIRTGRRRTGTTGSWLSTRPYMVYAIGGVALAVVLLTALVLILRGGGGPTQPTGPAAQPATTQPAGALPLAGSPSDGTTATPSTAPTTTLTPTMTPTTGAPTTGTSPTTGTTPGRRPTTPSPTRPRPSPSVSPTSASPSPSDSPSPTDTP